MAKEFIVAIELGSSHITGIAGKKNLDGSISVLSVVREDSSSCIRKGVVYNIDKTMQVLTSVIGKMEKALSTKILKVYVGVGGQSIRSIRNEILKELSADTIVNQDMVDELMDINRNMNYPDQEILDAITQEYKVDGLLQPDPVGIQCQKLQGNFLNILWRKSFLRTLNKCLENANIAVAELYIAPLALADSVLQEAEKRAGCVLVDLGADTTTVSVYYKNILRHMAVIPLGGNNITKDIATLQMEESHAERMKLQYGSAWTSNEDIDNDQAYTIDDDRKVEIRKFTEIVESRVEEIIENVWYQVPAEYSDKLLSGIILTGGGANMRNIVKAFRNHTHVEKVRIAKSVNRTVDATQSEITCHDCTMNTVLGLLDKGDKNCAGGELTNDLFGNDDTPHIVTTADLHQTARPLSETSGKGIVQTDAEKQKALEAERQRREEEERQRQEEEERQREIEEARRAEEERIRRENSIWNKGKRSLKNFYNSLFDPDDE